MACRRGRRQEILLPLATGTGKTFIAFQIAWKLFHGKWNLSREPGRRVQEAQHLLTVTEESVGGIAVMAGFYDQSHFTKGFKKVTGMAPLGYRKRFR